MRQALAAILIVGSLASCSRFTRETYPAPTGTREPSIVESSAMPTNSPENKACKLLNAEERASMPGYSMNVQLPVHAPAGTEQCIWVHSLRSSAPTVILLTAFRANSWAPEAVQHVNQALKSEELSPQMKGKLEDALAELAKGADTVPSERVCEIYLLSQEARGFKRQSDLTYYAHIGSIPAAFAISCENGILITAGYGEYGIRPSIAVTRGVVRLVAAASERAPEVFDEGEADDESVDEDEPTDRASLDADDPDAEESAEPADDQSDEDRES